MNRSARTVLIGALALASAPGSWSSGTGSITGTVTDVRTGGRLAGVSVSLYTCTGRFVTSATTNASGVYTTPATLDTGWYLARTRNALGYVNQLRRNQDCLGDCDVIVGSPVWVDASPVTIDFALRPGGRISGTVRNAAGAAVPDATLEIYDAFGVRMTRGRTDASGFYRSDDGLLTGTYHVVTGNQRQLIEEVYNDIPCPFGRCDATLGTPVSVTEGATTAKIDFTLAPGGRITGRVMGSSGMPATGSVDIYDATGYVTSAPIIAKGRYLTETGLVTGTYFAQTSVGSNDIDEIWDRAPCLPGEPASGRPIAVTVGATTSGIDFALSAGGAIEGRVTDDDTGADLDRASVVVYNSGGSFVTSGRTSAGDYTVGKLCTGNYHALARGPQGKTYVPELYRETTCSGCSVSLGTPISVTAGAVTRGIHFKPRLGSQITGVVTDAATRAARKGLTVSVFNALGTGVGTARVDCHGNGVYRAPENEGLPAGDYFLACDSYAGRPYSYGYRRQIYKDRDCATCDPTDGDRVAVLDGATTGGVNFDPVRRRRNGDYDLDGKSNLALYHPDTGDWVVRHADGTATSIAVLGGPGWRPAPNDLDGDGKTDPAVYDAAAGRWRVRGSDRGAEWSITHGGPGFTPLRGDLDGDGWADYLLYDGAGRWSLRVRGTVEVVAFGASGQVPVPADYDGDEKTDLALYDPASGLWMMRWSRNLTVKTATFGGAGQAPVTGDFDGDGRADLATFQSASATWRIRYSSDGRVVSGGFGAAGDQAVPFDYDGDGKTDIVVYGPSSGLWQIAPSSIGAPFTVAFGGGPLMPQN